MTAIIPDGLEPLAVWDANDPDWASGPWRERAEWADKHLGGARFIYRIEFYLIDTLFALVSRFAREASGHKFALEPGGKAVTEPPAIMPLNEPPPAHLLERP